MLCRKLSLFGLVAFLSVFPTGCGESAPPPPPTVEEYKANLPDEVRQEEERLEKRQAQGPIAKAGKRR